VDPNDEDEFLEYTCESLEAVKQVALECRLLEVAASSKKDHLLFPSQETT